MDDLTSKQAAINLVTDMEFMNDTAKGILRDRLRKLPSAQPELIEKAAYIRGFEQGRTQGMIDAHAQPEKNDNFEKQIHAMFDHIWDCEIAYPPFQDTVGDLMGAVIQCYKGLPPAQPEIIRCRDCRKYRKLDCPMGITVFDAPDPDGYCYKVERRTDDPISD